MNVLATNLRRHMEQHGVTITEVNSIILGSDKSDFINHMASLLGQNSKATVSYRLRRGDDLDVTINGMDITEWSSVMARIAPMLERIEDSRSMGASVRIRGGDNSPEQLDSVLDQLPATHVAGMETSFKPKTGE